MRAKTDFQAAICAVYGRGPDLSQIFPGRICRFATTSSPRDDSGWALLFGDERGGVFGDWRTNAEHHWQAEIDSQISAIDRELRAREIARGMADRAEEDRRRHDHAATQAALLFAKAVPFIGHAYSDRKRLPTAGLRLHRGDGRSSPFFVTGSHGRAERLRGDLILVPMSDSAGALCSLQAIDAVGRKSFLRGGRTRGTSFVIARHLLRGIDLATYGGEVAIVEGLATGGAVHTLSGVATFVAFSSGNLAAVAKAVRARLPRARILVAGDVDKSGAGQRAAEEAAAAVRGDVSFPPFTDSEIGAGMTDWCDWNLAHPQHEDRKVG